LEALRNEKESGERDLKTSLEKNFQLGTDFEALESKLQSNREKLEQLKEDVRLKIIYK